MNPCLATGEFYGQTLKKHSAAGFRLSETRYTPGSQLDAHSHESPYFGFVLQGTYTESYGRSLRACHPSMLIFHPAGELHAQRFDATAAQLFRVEVNHTRLGELEHLTSRLERAADFWDRSTIGVARRLYSEFSAPDAVSPLVIEGLGLELIAAIARISLPKPRVFQHPPQWLERALGIVKAGFLEPLTLGEIAQSVGVHFVTLAREFRRYYGCTIGEEVRRQRIEFACRQILQPEVKLAEVALAAGFYDQSHFSRAFKQVTGLTPTQFRANHRSVAK